MLTSHGFYWDDFIIIGYFYDTPLLSKDYLLQDRDGHLAPLAFLVQGSYHPIASWNWWLSAIIMAVTSIALIYATVRLFGLLTDRTLVSLFLITAVAWTPLMFPGDTWWSVAISSQPLHLALAVFMIVTIRTTTCRPFGPRLWEAVGLFALLVVALGFFEKPLTITPTSVLAVTTLAYMERRNTLQALRRGLVIWISLMLLTGAWALRYYFGPDETTGSVSDKLQSELFFNGLGQILAGIVSEPTN